MILLETFLESLFSILVKQRDSNFLPYLRISNYLNIEIDDPCGKSKSNNIEKYESIKITKKYEREIIESLGRGDNFNIALKYEYPSSKFYFKDDFTCDNFKDEDSSFWVDTSGFMENTTLEYMNLKYSLERDIMEIKPLIELKDRNEIALKELNKMVEKKIFSPN